MEQFKQEVIDYVDKCFKTAIVGAVYAIEQKYKDSPDFAAVRKQILDKGNDQKRNVISLLKKIGVSEAQYEYNFKFRGAE